MSIRDRINLVKTQKGLAKIHGEVMNAYAHGQMSEKTRKRAEREIAAKMQQVMPAAA